MLRKGRARGIERGPDRLSQISVSSALFLAGTGEQTAERCEGLRDRNSVCASELACCERGSFSSTSSGLVILSLLAG